jgi:hypothetical protein
MMRALAMAAMTVAIGCAAAPAPKTPSPVGSKAPYDAPAAGPHAIRISVDARPAQEILASLSKPRMDRSDVKVLEDLPAVSLAIQDSGRPAETFERDFAGAFEESSRTSVFDFHAIRDMRDRWAALLNALSARQEDLARTAARRAAALLPAQPVVSASVNVALTFGLAGLGDHLVGRPAQGGELLVVDLARALGDSGADTLESGIARLSRLIAGEAFRQGWGEYRRASPGWATTEGSLGDVAPLLSATAESGPVFLYGFDENFFPTFVWLQEPMRRAIDEFNRRADRFAESKDNLEQRAELLSESRRPEFRARIAGPAGAFMTDAIVETTGIDSLRAALASGPRAFFLAYDRATQSNRELIPLARSIRDRLVRP